MDAATPRGQGMGLGLQPSSQETATRNTVKQGIKVVRAVREGEEACEIPGTDQDTWPGTGTDPSNRIRSISGFCEEVNAIRGPDHDIQPRTKNQKGF